ncbi:Ni/Fe hydrogenase subunit alpha [Leptolyngbya boryana CZ1]|uniref:Ni/Fe hydrogenase subunit alpha n=1 Tax=Leptolyngbya boryana CZ1 TaxID=3060204 RepID=A0AA97ATB4_LEPBY|nr:Ni/Fe hydrogenase subunit alpha [Leptolyngbya boryana]WNZ48354.1 Ni/Fe hydrogenase subunit alpha [Leptolyngbya boryana CZ1]
MSSKTIKVDYLARVEGEGAMYVKIRDRKVQDVQLKIFEPPRFFEAFLRGRQYSEAPDITARICGICPIAYMMSSIHAMENILGIEVEGGLRALRRLIYCGEWIESHSLHIFMLHAPDFLGYESAIHMAKDYPELVQRGLRLKKIGNRILALIGGREIHPINIRVGGFYKLPTRQELRSLIDDLQWACDTAEETARWAATLPFPEFEQDYEFVALHHPNEYPMNQGRIISNKGLDISNDQFYEYIEEQHKPHSTALHAIIKERGDYLVGPIARFNLNFDQLTPRAQAIAREVGLLPICRNPFQSIVVRSIEVLFAVEEALRLIETYEMPDRAVVDYKIQAGVGHGCTEAPRGILYHRYKIDEKGDILDAKIAPPTSQNQGRIEHDLWQFVEQQIDLADDQLRSQCEQLIRNYDPCISCSTHFLKLDVDRA